MSCIAIIQARMSSKRLPGKVLMPLAGCPMIWHIVKRVSLCQFVDQILVATSTEPSDDPLALYCEEAGIECYRGSLSNVFSRYLEVLDAHPHDYVVRVTGDCPLIDPEFIDKQIIALSAHDGDQVWLSAEVSVLAGQSVHSKRSLQFINKHSSHPDDHEHVGSRYFAKNPELFRIIGMHPPKVLSEAHWRVTVDEQADYVMLQHLYEELWKGDPIEILNAVNWMSKNSEIANSNKIVKNSNINNEIIKKRKEWGRHVILFCNWMNPSKIL